MTITAATLIKYQRSRRWNQAETKRALSFEAATIARLLIKIHPITHIERQLVLPIAIPFVIYGMFIVETIAARHWHYTQQP